MKKFIFLDIETTGLNPKNGDKIIEIFCLETLNYKLTNRFFHVYINPKIKLSKENYSIHGISNKFLLNKPFFSDISNNFINFIKNSNLVIHNSKFDLSFLNNELKNLKLNKVQFYCKKIIDTLKIARKKFPGKKNSLKYLCKRFNIKSDLKFHSAFSDCIFLFKIFKYLNINENKINFIKKKKI